MLTLAPSAEAQLSEFGGRLVSSTLFSRVYQDARAALTAADTSGAWPDAHELPFGSRLAFEADSSGSWAVAFEAPPFEANTLRFGLTSGVLKIPADSNEVCRTIYSGAVRTGVVEWEGHGQFDVSGTTSSAQSCRLEAAGAG